MITPKTLAAPFLVVFVTVAACSDAQLYRQVDEAIPVFDNKLTLTGRACTTDPDDVEFPVKVFFMMDTSQSMNISDPPDPNALNFSERTGRARAVKEVISQFVDLDLQFTPILCNTGVAGCGPTENNCPVCPANSVCRGPICCSAPPCVDTPQCPPPNQPNATCLALCTADADCTRPGDRCMSGYCGSNRDRSVKFAIGRFNAGKEIMTKNAAGEDGFTNEPPQLASAIAQLSFGAAVTDYEGALRKIAKTLNDDMARGERNDATALGRSRYIVIFLSDGLNDPQIQRGSDWLSIDPNVVASIVGPDLSTAVLDQYNIDSRIIEQVAKIRDLERIYRVGSIELHTAFLSANPNSQVIGAATTLLQTIAQAGGGTFRSFPNGEAINFLDIGFGSLKRRFRMKSFLVSNFNTRPTPIGPVLDGDADGMSDEQETLAGTMTTRADTDGDGFSDKLEHFFRASGANALDPTDADCPLGGNDADGDGRLDDSDGDSLLDCEERFTGTNNALFDSDADGIPDGLETRFGTNPASNDALNDNLDFDNMTNYDEIRLNTDPAIDDAAHRSKNSYRYSVTRVGTGIEFIPTRCEANEDCAGGNCVDRACVCQTDNNCVSNAGCQNDDECTVPGETCDENGRCTSDKICQGHDTLPEDQLVCGSIKHVTCYDYAVENIALLTPLENDDRPAGWNSVYLYFGQVPFDTPDDFGEFSMACVRANFLFDTGRKIPADGTTVIPMSAWKDPSTFDPEVDCFCPDGSYGVCF